MHNIFYLMSKLLLNVYSHEKIKHIQTGGSVSHTSEHNFQDLKLKSAN